MRTYNNLFNSLVSSESLFTAWQEFKRGKTNKIDVLTFEYQLEKNIFDLQRDLRNKSYKHGPYTGFFITDPKRRHIHKATVRDRVVHHAVFNVINQVFEPTFIANSFSCRVNKGTHRGVKSVQAMIRKVSKNGTHSCYALKCDIQKFFDSVNHVILFSILKKRINDPDLLWLLTEIIESYTRVDERERESK